MSEHSAPQKHLRFFGIGKILPFLKPFRRVILIMTLWGLVTSAIDVAYTRLQKYSVDHFVSGGKLDYTVGSALDIFGGKLSYRELAACKGEIGI